MITYTGKPKTEKYYQYDFTGLSTDEKPTVEDFPDMRNGSTFFEMNTKKVFFYDAENGQWV